MNIFKYFKTKIIDIIKLSFDHSVTSENFNIEVPKDRSRGDLATNIAMVTAKTLRKSPKEIALTLADKISNLDYVEKVEVAGVGFINIKLQKQIWQELVRDILNLSDQYGLIDIGQGQKINVEFVSANPTGPMHIGHARSAIFGDALSHLLSKCGFGIMREYYINDAGSQIKTLAKSTIIRYRQMFGEDIRLEKGCYPGAYLIDIARQLMQIYDNKLLDMAEEEQYHIVEEFTVNAIMQLIKKDLQALGIRYDIFTSEKHDIKEHELIERSINRLQSKGLIYKGILTPPKGEIPEDWEPREQLLFKSTDFDDECDRPLQKSDNSYTYFASDVAYHMHKLSRGFDKLVLLLGADHIGYIKRLKAAVSALSDNQVDLEIKTNQLVNLYKNGQPYKMSKREGNFITVADILEEIDKDILRFVMLYRKNDTVLDIDFEQVKEQNKNNPVFYVQYAHTRAYSILSNASTAGFSLDIERDIDCVQYIVADEYIELIAKIATYPKVIEAAAKHYEPHRIAYYLYELAGQFHALWNLGINKPELKFIQEAETEVTKSRLLLVKAVAIIIKNGLHILGVRALEKM